MIRIATLSLATLAIPVLAQTSIDPINKFSWQENCGWMNWRDANNSTQGVRDHATFLSGYIWAENTGWINVGDGTPGGAAGLSYANTSGADFGVNIASTGELSGLAWGENIGWINFAGGALAVPPSPARLDSGRLRGYAWAENLGWINLDLAATGQHVSLRCYANCDNSTTPPVLNVQDFSCFLNAFASSDPYANCDRSTIPPVLNVADFSCFLNAFASGCP